MSPVSPIRNLADMYLYNQTGSLDPALSQLTLARRELMQTIMQAGRRPCEMRTEWDLVDELSRRIRAQLKKERTPHRNGR